MNKLILVLVATIFVFQLYGQPVSLHPDNPHYFIYKNKPTVLITSAEHYGAVLNTGFDFRKYLQNLHEEGMNYTRVFTGSYVEIPGSFGIEKNTLAPAVGKFIAPWKRTNEPGLYKGEKKFDLSQWDPDYFKRLKAFVSLAEELDIIVEVTFFSSTYQDSYWERNPFNPQNNVNEHPDDLERKKSNTLENGNLAGFQQKMVEKIVVELNEYDNILFEIQNEPWSDDPQKVMRILRTLDPNPGQGGWFKWAEEASRASLKWHKVMAQTIVNAEKQLPKKHLVAQNYTNFKHSVSEVDPNIDILNFHYAWPEAVWLNYGWDRPVVFDESGFAGKSDTTYLRQAWQFMLAGGAGFNNLDYSFYSGKEDGTGKNNAPGGGSTNLRSQLAYLNKFLNGFEFVKMQPDFNVVYHAPGLEWQAISEPGKQYAVLFTGNSGQQVKLDLPKGKYNFRFVSPFTGKKLKSGFFTVEKGKLHDLTFPTFSHMVALEITK